MTDSAGSVPPPKRVFIVGPPRSGTTLVQSILVASERIYSPPESHFFSKVSALYEQNSIRRVIASNVYLRRWARRNGLMERPRPFTTFLSAARSFQLMLDRESRRRGFRIWAEKTPAHVQHIQKIRQGIDSPFFIFVGRNPLDNVRSYRRVQDKWYRPNPDRRSLAYAISRWCSDTIIALTEFDASDSIWVDYDSLVQAPHEVIEGLLVWLGIPLDSVEDFDIRAAARKVIADDEPWKVNNTEYALQRLPKRMMESAEEVRLQETIERMRYRLNGGGG